MTQKTLRLGLKFGQLGQWCQWSAKVTVNYISHYFPMDHTFQFKLYNTSSFREKKEKVWKFILDVLHLVFYYKHVWSVIRNT